MFDKLTCMIRRERKFYNEHKVHEVEKQGQMFTGFSKPTTSTVWQGVADKMSRMCQEPYDESKYWAGKRIK